MSHGFPPPENDPPDEPNPYASPLSSRVEEPNYHYQQGAFQGRPHQGGLVLSLGIIGVVVTVMGWAACPIVSVFGLALSIPAWTIARKDLRLMDAGQTDPSGRSLVTAGLVTGIIGTILGVLSLLLVLAFVGFFFFVIVAGSAGA